MGDPASLVAPVVPTDGAISSLRPKSGPEIRITGGFWADRLDTNRERTIPAAIPDEARAQLIEGTWDATGLLLEAGDRIEAVGSTLPYVAGY